MIYKRLLLVLVATLTLVSSMPQPTLAGDELFERRDQLILDWVLTAPNIVDETVPSEIFRILRKNKKNEKAWRALHRYKTFTDAGSSLMFYRDCFRALEDDPVIFLNRYIAGDEQALFRMVDALTHDFSAFERETFEHTDQVFRKSLRQVSDAMLNHSGEHEKYRRIYDFERVAVAQYCYWRLRYRKNQPCEYWK